METVPGLDWSPSFAEPVCLLSSHWDAGPFPRGRPDGCVVDSHRGALVREILTAPSRVHPSVAAAARIAHLRDSRVHLRRIDFCLHRWEADDKTYERSGDSDSSQSRTTTASDFE